MARKIAVIGTGYVGLVSAVGLADFGNTVVGVDIRKDIVDRLNSGEATIYEHGIDDYLERNLKAGRLIFTDNIAYAVKVSEVVFLAVGTPSKDDGDADLSQITAAAESVAEHVDGFKLIVIKSTVPVGTNRKVAELIASKAPDKDFAVVSNPEFLREGRAVQDFFHPDRVVIGTEDERARSILEEIYRPLYLLQTPVVWANWETAELIKYASNSFLATKISFINQMANLAEACGADIHQVARTMGMDGRISPKFLHPGPGFGGSCFPKDSRAVVAAGTRCGVDMSLVREVMAANEAQKERVVAKLEALAGGLADKEVAVLGLAFKAETDDIREAPALAIVDGLLAAGAKVRVHDPKALDNFRAIYADRVSYFNDEFEAAADADCLLILTEWNEYRNLDLERVAQSMRGTIILDTRNVLDAETARRLGFTYRGTGR